MGKWHEIKALDTSDLNKLKDLHSAMDELGDIRQKILAQTIPVSHSIDFYTHRIVAPIQQLMVLIAFHMKENLPLLVSAYNAFLQWKERIGLERGIGVRGFNGKDGFQDKEFVERMLFLISEQKNHQNTFFELASESQKKLVSELGVDVEEKKLNELHKLIQQHPVSQIQDNLTPDAWYDLITVKIDALHAVERKLIDTLSEVEVEAEQNKPPIGKIDSSQAETKYYSDYLGLIKSLQVFSGLSNEALHSLLYHGQIRTLEKGNILFLEGEIANRLYIILKGWIKIVKHTIDGEEGILQMLSAGDSIMESTIFLNATFPASAQVVDDAIVLSLPAPIFREQLKNNNALILNFLTSMSHRSQDLIRQIEYARLKSVDERVGWFLLKLLLEQGGTSRVVKLPYDKTLIASYLDMKRETFSRSLKRLKDKGFIIGNNTIELPDVKSLCSFCDLGLAQTCRLHGKPDCPNPQCNTTLSVSD